MCTFKNKSIKMYLLYLYFFKFKKLLSIIGNCGPDSVQNISSGEMWSIM